jgi:hypothetical protein
MSYFGEEISPNQELLDQLTAGEVKTRVAACQAVAKGQVFEAIPTLLELYQNPLEDKKVKTAAAHALTTFGKLIPAEWGTASRLRYAAIGLAVSLVILIGLNVVLRLGGGEEPTAPPVEAPADRAALLAQYQTLYERTFADYQAMRQEWDLGPGNLTCSATLNRSKELPLRKIDKEAFPDFAPFVDPLNLAITILNSFPIRFWDQACEDDSKGTMDQALSSSDELKKVENFLNTAKTALDNATNNPLPTRGPSPTPGSAAPTTEATMPSAETPTPEILEPTPSPGS